MSVDELYGDVLDALTRAQVPEYQVAIPSYMRPDECAYRTLSTLDRLHVDHDRVTVFVADDHQADIYSEALNDEWRIVVAKPGLAACRAWYSDVHYPAGTRILNMDDDVLDLLARNADGKLEPWKGTVDQLALMGWTIADTARVNLWGISAVENGFYMADEAVIGLRYICGIMHGTRAGDPLNGSDLSSGADFVRSIRQFRAHGGVVQLRWLTPHTVYFAPGGMQAELGGEQERAADHAARLRVIARTYPKDARLVTKATGPNLRLRAVTHLRIPRSTIEGTLNP